MTGLHLETLDDIKMAMSVLDDKISAGKGEGSLLDYAQHLQNTYKTPAHVKFLAEMLDFFSASNRNVNFFELELNKCQINVTFFR